MSVNPEQSKEVTSLATEIVADRLSLIWKIFEAFVDGSDLSASEDDLIKYAVDELKVDLEKLPSVFVESLPLILVAFMNSWSGWHFKTEFQDGKFEKEHYFNRFRKYMNHKIRGACSPNSVSNVMKTIGDIDNKYKTAMESTEMSAGLNEKLNCNDNDIPFSNFAISIQCPPQLLNTIAFTNDGDDVIMRPHVSDKWQDLSTSQLVNWPYVEVSFRTQDLCFIRRQATEFVRYLNFLSHECKKGDENIIEQLETLRNHEKNRVCFSYRFLEAYIKEYILALKTLKDITERKLEEIETILGQFLEDVRCININNSMATNTVVLFRLSKVPFIRNKKLMKNPGQDAEEARVGYCEIITPKVELVLLYCKAKQKDTPYVSFELPDKIKKTHNPCDVNSLLPCITYKCTFCQVEYDIGDTKKSMIEHLKRDHRADQHVRCTACKQQYNVFNLAACRWRHKCITSDKL